MTISERRSGVLLVDDCGPPDGWDDAPFTFVTEDVEAALNQASEQAGHGVVGIAGASVVRQCLRAGILDAVRVSLVSYLIGEGARRAGRDSARRAHRSGGGEHVTHLHYGVER